MSRLFPGIERIPDENLRKIVYDMAMKLEMLCGSAPGLLSAPAKIAEGQVERFQAGIVGASAGLYEYRRGLWVKL